MSDRVAAEQRSMDSDLGDIARLLHGAALPVAPECASFLLDSTITGGPAWVRSP
jgi:hypothetical protein